MRRENNSGIKASFLRKIRLGIIKIYRAQGSVNEIAVGAAIGAFISVFPTFGLGMPLVIILYRFMRFNVIAALSASLISNPFTSPFFLVLSYKTGSFFIKTETAFNIDNWTDNLKELGLVMLVGATLFSTLVSIIVFFLTKYFVTQRRKKILK